MTATTTTIETCERIMGQLRALAEANWKAQTPCLTLMPTHTDEPDVILAHGARQVNRGANLLGSSVCSGYAWIAPARAETLFRELAATLGVEITETRKAGFSEFTWGPGAKLGTVSRTVG